jgi:vitamin B12 transporter
MKSGNQVFSSTFLCFLILFCLMSTRVFAQADADTAGKKDSIATLSPAMKVNAMRFEVEPEKLPQKIEFIDSLDLELTPSENITDVLKKTASIDVIQYPGVLAGVGIRGFRPSFSGINQRTLTLLNGRPAGATNLATMQAYNLDRIEVVKGPVSALYGPQAMGGAINIVPKRSVGPVNSRVKLNLSSFETIEMVAHSGGSLFDFLNFDFSGAVTNQGKNFRIGSNYCLGNLSPSRFSGKPQHILADGDTVDVDDVEGGTQRTYTKYDKQNFALRIGADLFDDRLKIDVRGELFGADGVETPGDIVQGNLGAGFKNVSRKDQEVRIRGDFDRNKFELLQYYAEESSDRYADFEEWINLGGFRNFADFEKMFGFIDSISEGTVSPAFTELQAYKNSASGAKWTGFQAKDHIYLPSIGDGLLGPVLTLGVDINNAESWSQKWDADGEEIAPYSPDSRQSDFGVYGQVFGDLRDGLATLTAGLRFDRITAEVLKSKYFPNNVERIESFNVMSPSYGLTFVPTKLVTDKVAIGIYHNLGKGFIPQSAGNIAGYSVSKPDTTGRVQVLRGNPDLEPESNITVDGGIRASVADAGLSAEVGVYRTVVENFVEYSYDSVPSGMSERYEGKKYPVAAIKTYKNNDDKTTMAGLEWNLEWNLLKLTGRQERLSIGTGGHTVLLSEAISGTDTSQIDNVRDHTFNVSLTYDDNRIMQVRLQSRYSGKQTDTDWSATVYPYPDIIYRPFLITDLSMHITISEHHAINGCIANLTDENYYEKRGYNLAGRSFSLGYELSF